MQNTEQGTPKVEWAEVGTAVPAVLGLDTDFTDFHRFILILPICVYLRPVSPVLYLAKARWDSTPYLFGDRIVPAPLRLAKRG